jgi:hypothetical protein
MTERLFDRSRYSGKSLQSQIRENYHGFLGISSGSESAMNEIGNQVASIERNQGIAHAST